MKNSFIQHLHYIVLLGTHFITEKTVFFLVFFFFWQENLFTFKLFDSCINASGRKSKYQKPFLWHWILVYDWGCVAPNSLMWERSIDLIKTVITQVALNERKIFQRNIVCNQECHGWDIVRVFASPITTDLQA